MSISLLEHVPMLQPDFQFIVDEFRRTKIIDHLARYINQVASKQFWISVERQIPVSRTLGEGSSQITTQVTAQLNILSSDFWANEASVILSLHDSPLVVVDRREDENDDSYDLIILNRQSGKESVLEAKNSQSPNGWLGSMSSGKKVPNFLLTHTQLNTNLILHLGENREFVTGFFGAVVSLAPADWSGGRASMFRFENSERWNLEALRQDCILKGNIVPKRPRKGYRSWCAVEHAPVDYME